jgi:FkbM family methyltransferase
MHVALRHGTTDVAAFDEIFIERDYDLPPTIASRLGTDRLRVLDLGANVGLFAVWLFSRFPHADVTSVEADPGNVHVLRRARESNAGVAWTVVHAAAATADGSVRFSPGKGTSSHVTTHADPTAIDVPAVDVLPLLDEHDLVKMDIEGSEWQILADPRFAETRARVLVLEYHRPLVTAAPPVGDAREILEAAGFQITAIREKTRRLGVVWACRE